MIGTKEQCRDMAEPEAAYLSLSAQDHQAAVESSSSAHQSHQHSHHSHQQSKLQYFPAMTSRPHVEKS